MAARSPQRVQTPEHKLNEQIRSAEVRITGLNPATGEKFTGDVLNTRDALALAKSFECDMILITESANPPVVQIADYKKYLYEQKKHKKEKDANSKKIELKELRLTPNTDDHDLDFKTKHAISWLNKGDKVKAVVVFKGRMMSYKDRGELILLKLASNLADAGIPESMPILDGRKMFMIFKPKKV
jgi:translation initiation factor IF-3